MWWLISLILICHVLTLAAIWVLLVTHNRDWLTRFVEHEAVVNDHFHDLRRRVEQLPISLRPSLPPPPPEPWMGIVLPTDETNAEVERRLQRAEDHAMSASDLRPGSSPPSRRSERTSSGTSSTRPARSSGRG